MTITNFNLFKYLLNITSVLVFLLLISGFSSNPNQNSLSIELQLDKKSLIEGRVVVLSEITNNSRKKHIFLPWNTPLDTSINGPIFKVLEVKDKDDKVQRDYQGRIMKRVEPTDSDYIVLPPGASKLGKLDITEAYQFCSNKTYRIEVSDLSMNSLNNDFAKKITPAAFVEFMTTDYFKVCKKISN